MAFAKTPRLGRDDNIVANRGDLLHNTRVLGERGNICSQTRDHAHYPPTLQTKSTRPSHASSQNLYTILKSTFKITPQYDACRKNQSVDNTKTKTYDGCREFVSGEEDDPMMYAACGCHRRFHCEESNRSDQNNQISKAMVLDALKISSDQFLQIFCSPYDDDDDGDYDLKEKEEIHGREKKVVVDRSNGRDSKAEDKVIVDGSNGGDSKKKKKFTMEQTEKIVVDRYDGGGLTAAKIYRSNGGDSTKEKEIYGRDKRTVVVDGSNNIDLSAAKRLRTKFTAEQTEKMRSKAEKLTWKLGPENKKEIERFVKKLVLILRILGCGLIITRIINN